jgi:hypothetical protein
VLCVCGVGWNQVSGVEYNPSITLNKPLLGCGMGCVWHGFIQVYIATVVLFDSGDTTTPLCRMSYYHHAMMQIKLGMRR